MYATHGSWTSKTASWVKLARRRTFPIPKMAKRRSQRKIRSNNSRKRVKRPHRLILRKREARERSLLRQNSLSYRKLHRSQLQNQMSIRMTSRRALILSNSPSRSRRVLMVLPMRNLQTLLRPLL